MYWLSAKIGQEFLAQVAKTISSAAEAGKDSIEITIKRIQRPTLVFDSGDEELVDTFAPISSICIGSNLLGSAPLEPVEFSEIFEKLGYATKLKSEARSPEEFMLSLSW